MKGYVYFEDEGGKRSKTSISDVTSLEALNTFVQSFQSFSNAKITGYGVVTMGRYEGEFKEGAFRSVEDKAQFSFHDLSDADETSTMSLQLPAPDDDVMEFVHGVGRRVKSSMGHALAAMLQTLTGKPIEFTTGHFRATKTQAQR